MDKALRSLNLRTASAYTTRTEEFEGREYLVVPVVALVETVVFASNAEFPELVTEEEFSKAPIGWNGRPVFHGHPQIDGVYVSGNVPSLLETEQIGIVFNTHVEDGKLKMEAWIDVKKAEIIAPALLTRVGEGEVVQISVGLSAATLNESGIFHGKEYKGKWVEMVPDHLALLPPDEIGACSVEAGCGIRAAIGNGNNQYEHDNPTQKENPTTRPDGGLIISTPVKGGFAEKRGIKVGSEVTYHYRAPGDDKGKNGSGKVIGFVKNPPHIVKMGSLQDVAIRSGDSVLFVAEKNVRKKNKSRSAAEESGTMVKRNTMERMLSMLRSLVAPEELSDHDIRRKLSEAVGKENGSMYYCYVEAVYQEKGDFIYSSQGSGGLDYYRRSFTIDGNGAVTLGDKATEVEVEPLLTYPEVGGDEEIVVATETPITALTAPCGCQHPKAETAAVETPVITSAEEKGIMNKDELIAKLAGATDEQIASAAKAFEAQAAVAAPVVETVAAPVAAATAALSADEKEALAVGLKTLRANKAAAIKALKDSGRCTISDERLNGMSQSDLDELVALSGATAAVAEVNYGLNGLPRAAEADETVAPPPDMGASIRAARSFKDQPAAR